MIYSSEHRLLHYIKRTDDTRYSKRVAEANAQVQADTHQQALAKNQAAAGFQDTATTIDANRQDISGAESILQQAGNAGQFQTYNTQTGESIAAPQLGAIDQSALERLTASGMSEGDARRQIGDRANVQQAFNQVGTQVDPFEEIKNRVTKQYKDMGINDPAVISDAISKALDVENKRLEQEDILTEREKKRAEASATRTAAGAKAEGKSTDASKTSGTPQTSKMDSIATMLDGIIGASGDPMGPVYKEMILQDLQDKEDAMANAEASLDASVERAEDQNTAVQNMLDKYLEIHRKNNDKYTDLLDETRDAQQKYLAEQEQRDLDRLAWESDRETQKLTKQKSDQLLSQSIQNALGGGAFSGAANEQLAATEREWDTVISNLAKEYSFKKADVSAFYTQKYIDTNNQFNMDVFNAAKALDEKIEGYSIQGFNSLQAMENAKTAAANDYRTAIDTAKKDYSTKIQGYVKEISTTLKEERKAKLDRQNALWDRLFTQRAQDGNLNPGFTKQILDQMEEAGIDTTGIDPNAMTESQINELHRNALAQAKAERDANGRPMTAGQVKEIAEFDNSLSLLENVKTNMLVNFANVGGPVASKLGAIPGAELFSEGAMRQREFEAQVNLVKQVIGKALEGGVLRKEDEVKYEKILPNIKDTDRIRASKIAQLAREIQAKKAGLLQTLSLSGYNTSGFDFGDPLQSSEAPRMTDDEAQQILERLESGEPLTFNGPNAGVALASLGTTQTQGFDTPISTNLYSPATIKAWNGQHKGIDVAMPVGTKLPAVTPGKVIAAGYQDGWGNTVVIQAEDGSEHRYSHLDAINVKRGSTVTKGQIIALSGGAKGAKGAGTSTGPHLDYRVKVNGKYIDPYSYTIS